MSAHNTVRLFFITPQTRDRLQTTLLQRLRKEGCIPDLLLRKSSRRERGMKPSPTIKSTFQEIHSRGTVPRSLGQRLPSSASSLPRNLSNNITSNQVLLSWSSHASSCPSARSDARRPTKSNSRRSRRSGGATFDRAANILSVQPGERCSHSRRNVFTCFRLRSSCEPQRSQGIMGNARSSAY